MRGPAPEGVVPWGGLGFLRQMSPALECEEENKYDSVPMPGPAVVQRGRAHLAENTYTGQSESSSKFERSEGTPKFGARNQQQSPPGSPAKSHRL